MTCSVGEANIGSRDKKKYFGGELVPGAVYGECDITQFQSKVIHLLVPVHMYLVKGSDAVQGCPFDLSVRYISRLRMLSV